MDARVKKIIHRGLSNSIATLLVASGDFDTPRKIKAASDDDLKTVVGIGDSAVEQIRSAIPVQ